MILRAILAGFGLLIGAIAGLYLCGWVLVDTLWFQTHEDVFTYATVALFSAVGGAIVVWLYARAGRNH